MSAESPGRHVNAAQRLAAATFVVLSTFGVYHRTLYPGLVPFGDSPKMQFVGRIWGTPHNPGYPLYIVVSHLFGLIPIGTIAYRINLMSAVFGAVACAVMTLLVARLTARVSAGIASGLALGLGRVFWSQSIVAEVYALATALLVLTLVFTARWVDTRRNRDLLSAVTFAALAVGHHLTIVMFAPGLVLMVLATDWRRALRPRMVVAMTVIVIAGLSQYLLILELTRRGAPYLETQAHSLNELMADMSGAQFHSWLGHFSLRELLTTRAAAMFEILMSELHLWGLLLAGAGLVRLAVRRGAVAAGLLLSAACVWGFVVDYDVKDSQVFLIPIIVVLWIFAGAGVALLVDVATRWRTPAGMAVALLVPALGTADLVRENYRYNDHHRRTYEITEMNDLFLALPPRAAIIPASYADELMLTYKLYAERAGSSRDIVLIHNEPAAVRGAVSEGRPVFAVSSRPDELNRQGFRFEPVPLVTPFRDGHTEPFGTDPVLFRLSDIRECRDIADEGWIDITPVAAHGRLTARIDNYRPFDSDLWLVVGRDGPGRSTLASFSGPGQPKSTSATYPASDNRARDAALQAAGTRPALPSAPFTDVFHVSVNDNGDFELLTIDFGSTPRFVWSMGTTDLHNPKRLSVCSGDAGQ